MNLSEQAARLTELRDQILTLADTDGDLSDEDAARYAELNTEFDELRATHEADFVRAAEYAQRVDAVRNFEAGAFEAPEERRQAPAFHREVDPFDERTISEIGPREAAVRAIGETTHIDADAQAEAMRKLDLVRTDGDNMRGFDQYVLRHGSDDYTSAFLKMAAGRSWDLTDAEKHAFKSARQFDSERGLTLTAANGGAMIPTFLDPTVILTNAGTTNPLRQISRVVSVMSNVWNGVTSDGITLAYGTEGGDSSDVAATYQSPSVTCYKASGTVPATIEAFEDIQGLGAEVARELADAKDRLDAQVFTKGTGSNQPIGVVTALYTETSRWSSHTTNSAMTATDVLNTQNTLGARAAEGGAHALGVEVVLGRGVADPDPPGRRAQREGLSALFVEDRAGSRDERLPVGEVPVGGVGGDPGPAGRFPQHHSIRPALACHGHTGVEERLVQRTVPVGAPLLDGAVVVCHCGQRTHGEGAWDDHDNRRAERNIHR